MLITRKYKATIEMKISGIAGPVTKAIGKIIINEEKNTIATEILDSLII